MLEKSDFKHRLLITLFTIFISCSEKCLTQMEENIFVTCFHCSLGPAYEFVCDSFRTSNLNCFKVNDHVGQHGICAKT